MDWDKKKDKDKDCDCCIEIEDSFVLIICGELDHDKLKDSLKTFVEIKGNTILEKRE